MKWHQFSILRLLLDAPGPMTGAQINDCLRHRIPAGSLYPELSRLRARGLVAYAVGGAKLTKRGKIEFANFLKDNRLTLSN